MEKDASANVPAPKEGQNGEGQQHTLRFTLELKDSSDKYFPEFSFRELLRSAVVGEAKSKSKEKDKIWPEEDSEDEKLQQLARQFEEKYNPKPAKQKSKKRRKERIADLVDVTYGYDETDPFVDNTEAYDELIPSDWTTEHGGFYINQGGLNFRPISSDDSDDDFKGVKKRKIPKKLKDPNKVKKFKSPADKERKRKHNVSADKEKKPKKVKLISGDKEKKHKKKLNMNVTPSAASGAIPGTSTLSSTTSPISPSVSSISITSGISNGMTTPVTHSTASSPPDSIKVEAVNEDSIPLAQVLAAQAAKQMTEGGDSSSAAVNQNGVTGEGGSSDVSSIVPKLPDTLPASIEVSVLSLKQAATNPVDEGKCKFFNKDVNQMLLGIETQSRELGCRVRSGIYDYLAFYLPCTKETLLKRAKKLLLTDQASRLREPMAKLKAAVDKVMPEQIKAFEEEVRKHVEEESKASESKQGNEETEDKKKELFKSVMEVEDEGEKTEEATTPTEQPSTAASQTEEKTKKMVPKRKFVWTQELRELLHDVVTVKVKLFEMSKTRTTSGEEFLKEFFDAEVKLLWPKGWMTCRILFRESKTVHSRITIVPNKIKKVPGPKKQGEASPNFPTVDTNSQAGDAVKEDKGPVPSEAHPTVSHPSSIAAAAAVIQSSVLTPGLVKQPAVTTTSVITAPTVKTLANTSTAGTTKLALKITPIAVSNLSLSKPSSVTAVKFITTASTPASSLISSLANVAKLASSSVLPATSASVMALTPSVIQSLPVGTVGATTKSESTVVKSEGQLRGNTTALKQACSAPVISRPPSTTVLVRNMQKPQQPLATSASHIGQQPLATTALHTGQQQTVKFGTDSFGSLANSVIKSQPVTILDFADILSADDGPDILGKPLQSQGSVSKSPLQMQQKDVDMSSPGTPKPVPSPQRQGTHYTSSSPSKVIRSPSQGREQLSHLGMTQMMTTSKAQITDSVPTPRDRVSSVPTPTMVTLTHPASAMTRDFVSAANMAQSREHASAANMAQSREHASTVTYVRQPVANTPTTPPRVSMANVALSREQLQLAAGRAATVQGMGMHSGVNMGNRRPSDAMGNPTMVDMQNNFIDLNTAAMVSHQRQQAAANKALLDAIASTSRVSMNMGGNTSVPLNHPVITRQLSNPTQGGYLYTGVPHSAAATLQPQMMSMMGRGNIQSKATTPLSHMSMPPLPQAGMMHMNQQQQQQLQFNQVLLGYNQALGVSPGPPCSGSPSPAGLQLPTQATLLTSNTNMYQDPNQSTGGTHPPSPYMGRFS